MNSRIIKDWKYFEYYTINLYTTNTSLKIVLYTSNIVVCLAMIHLSSIFEFNVDLYLFFLSFFLSFELVLFCAILFASFMGQVDGCPHCAQEVETRRRKVKGKGKREADNASDEIWREGIYTVDEISEGGGRCSTRNFFVVVLVCI